MRTEQTLDRRPLALIGFGEAGTALAEGWQSQGERLPIHVFDRKTDDSTNSVAAAMWDHYSALGVTGHDSAEAAMSGAQAVFSLVTADQAHKAAQVAARHIAPDTLFFDMNSCAPDTKRASAKVIDARGARYVDTAIMSPIRPKRHKAPMLLSGPHADAAARFLTSIDMAPRALGGDVGHASSVKMLRSVVIKGIEALTAESLLAARRAGVEADVIASLNASMPGWDWEARAGYNLERMTTHGIRRAAEMREVAQTLADLDVAACMAQSTVAWQDEIGGLGIDSDTQTYQDRADAILAALETRNHGGTQ